MLTQVNPLGASATTARTHARTPVRADGAGTGRAGPVSRPTTGSRRFNICSVATSDPISTNTAPKIHTLSGTAL